MIKCFKYECTQAQSSKDLKLKFTNKIIYGISNLIKSFYALSSRKMYIIRKTYNL